MHSILASIALLAALAFVAKAEVTPVDCGSGKGPTAADASECEDCETGKFSAANNKLACAAYTTCTAGQYISTPGTASEDQDCTACGAGSYQPATDANGCTPCPSGGTATSATAIALPTSSTLCWPCQAGQYWIAEDNACTACPDGKFKAGKGPDACAAHTTCTVGVATAGTAIADVVCKQCTAGQFYASAAVAEKSLSVLFSLEDGAAGCRACEGNTYAPSAGTATTCTACPAGTTAFTDKTRCVTDSASTSSAAGVSASLAVVVAAGMLRV